MAHKPSYIWMCTLLYATAVHIKKITYVTPPYIFHDSNIIFTEWKWFFVWNIVDSLCPCLSNGSGCFWQSFEYKVSQTEQSTHWLLFESIFLWRLSIILRIWRRIRKRVDLVWCSYVQFSKFHLITGAESLAYESLWILL